MPCTVAASAASNSASNPAPPGGDARLNEILTPPGYCTTNVECRRMTMNDLDQEETERLEGTIAWLKQNSPDDWHRVALDFNWGEPLYLLDWIVRQPDCDIATAVTIFWKGEPECWLEEDGSVEHEAPNGFSDLNKALCVYIAERVAAKGYTRSQIAFHPDAFTKAYYVDLAAQSKELSKPNINVVPDLIRKRGGRKVELDEAFYRRFPEAFHCSAWIGELPDWTPQSKSLWDNYLKVEAAVGRKLPLWLRFG
jgi:Domain of unknown function (DUF4274)